VTAPLELLIELLDKPTFSAETELVLDAADAPRFTLPVNRTTGGSDAS
jgi:hypothetical protein